VHHKLEGAEQGNWWSVKLCSAMLWSTFAGGALVVSMRILHIGTKPVRVH